MAIKVKARQRGYYGLQLREQGAVFTIQTEQELGKWMERVAPGTRPDAEEPVTTKPTKGKRVSDDSPI